MQNAEELAHYFVYYITQSRVGVEARIQSALSSIQGLTNKGWSLYEIKQELEQFAKDYPQVVQNIYHIGEIMDKKEPPSNILEPDVFYYHGELRNMPKPPKLVKDKKTGEYIRHSEPFFLEIKPRYSMQELLNYWYEQQAIKPTEHMIRQDEGKFKYILGNYNLDEILFSIDAANVIRKEQTLKPLRNAFELDKYIEHARELIAKKQNAHKMQGINREFRRDTEY
jgi:hypothetical protein